MTPVSETPCIAHEEQIQENSKKIAELEAKNGFKAQRINDLIEDNRRIESKIDNLILKNLKKKHVKKEMKTVQK